MPQALVDQDVRRLKIPVDDIFDGGGEREQLYAFSRRMNILLATPATAVSLVTRAAKAEPWNSASRAAPQQRSSCR